MIKTQMGGHTIFSPLFPQVHAYRRCAANGIRCVCVDGKCTRCGEPERLPQLKTKLLPVIEEDKDGEEQVNDPEFKVDHYRG